jgi:hypothetical protein
MYHLEMPSVLSNFFLSCKNQNQAQNNAVVVQQEEMDWVGWVEPTTSAIQQLVSGFAPYSLSKSRRYGKTTTVQIPPLSALLKVVLWLVETAIEEMIR